MRSLPKWVRFAAAAFLFVTLAQCSNKKTKSDLVEITVVPDEPIVIKGDTKDANGNTVKGPWFQYRLHVKNSSTQPVTIIALSLTFYEQDSSGQTTNASGSASASDFNFDTKDERCEFTSFGSYAAGDDIPLYLDGSALTDCQGFTPVFYTGGHNSGIGGKNFRYRVVVEPLGWFGTYADPTDRFDKEFTFYTR